MICKKKIKILINSRGKVGIGTLAKYLVDNAPTY